jgi:hypothetical protein
MAGKQLVRHSRRRKRRTRAHIIADLSVNHVERFILRCGHTAEIRKHDYGIDMVIEFYNRAGEVKNGEVLVQIKATDHLKWSSPGRTILFDIDSRDLHYWNDFTQPVMLVLYDARNDRAYWLYLQAYFQAMPKFDLHRARTAVRVHIPGENVLNDAAILRFAKYNDDVVRQQQGTVQHHD